MKKLAKNEVVIENGEEQAVVLRSSLGVWERNGWTAVDDGDSEPVSKDEPVTYAVPTGLRPLQVPGNTDNKE